MPGAVRKAKAAARETIAAVTSPRTPKTPAAVAAAAAAGRSPAVATAAGRSPAVATSTPATASSSSASTPASAVRRRGRPPKKKPEAAPSTEASEASVGAAEAPASADTSVTPAASSAERSASFEAVSSIGVAPSEASEDDFAEPPSKIRKKPGRKKASDAAAASASAVSLPRATQPRKAAVASDDGDDGDLFSIIKAGKAAMQTVVDDWIDTYKKDKDRAMLELMQFLVQSSGCRGRITPQMYRRLDDADRIRKLTEEFDEESCSYPLVTAGQQWRRFRSGLCEFIGTLIRRCQHGIIYDGFLTDRLINFLTGLADSQVRAFRHTSTLIMMKLMSALVDVALYVRANMQGTQQQQESERLASSAGRGRGAGDRGSSLAAKAREWQQNQEDLNMMMQYIFKGVFVHRYRDVVPDIRCICISEIGYWMRKYPTIFLEDSYLKYVGWTLFDKVGEVRLTCLQTLHPLYDDQQLAANMALFTSRFKDRIVEMTLDKEYDVAVAAVKLVTNMLRYDEQVLTDKDCENVYELIYASHRGVAQAAGEFLNAKIFKLEAGSGAGDQTGGGVAAGTDEQQQTPARSKRTARRRNPNMSLLRDLVLFFIESELHEHAAYLVDSLWEYGALLKDWQCMTDALLEEPNRGEEPLDDKQESCLIEIMHCCVCQAATGQSPVGRGPSNRKLTAKEQKQVKDDKAALTKHFIVALPQLLSKYSSDAEKTVNLLSIALQFDLEAYTITRQEKELDNLLKQVQDIVEKHSQAEVLDACARVIEYVCDEEAAISGRAEVAKSTLTDAVVSRYTTAYTRYFDKKERSDDVSYALQVATQRLQAFAQCVDVSSYDLWDGVHHILHCSNESPDGPPGEVVCSAIAISHCLLLWHLKKLDSRTSDAASIKKLKTRVAGYLSLLQELLYHANQKVVDAAFVTLCDLLVTFGSQLAVASPSLASLVVVPDKSMQTHLGAFINERVFVDDDDSIVGTGDAAGDENEKIDLLHNRRNFLASFGKLVAYNVIGIRNAATMFKHFGKFYNDYGDIIRATLQKSREINRVATAKALAVSLTKLYREKAEDQGGRMIRNSPEFQEVKELARKFAMSFGVDAIKNREAVVALHREGIMFGLKSDSDGSGGAPANLVFLEVLSEFTGKLIRQDKKAVMAFLDKQLRNSSMPAASDILGGGDGGDNEWQPLIAYRAALVAQHYDQDSRSIATVASSVKSGRSGAGSARRKKPSLDLDGSFRTPTGRRGRPPLTSTAVKRRRTDDGSSPASNARLNSSASSEADFDARSRLTASAIPEEDESAAADDDEAVSISQFSSSSTPSVQPTPPVRRGRGRPRGSGSAGRRAAPPPPPRVVEEADEEDEATLIEERSSELGDA